MGAGMKTTWVLNEQEKKIFFEGRGKTKRPEKEVFKAPLPPKAKLQPISYISDEETVEVENSVRISGYFDGSKVNDLGTGLVRELIRQIVFHL